MTIVAGPYGFGRRGERREEKGAMEYLQEEDEDWDADCCLGAVNILLQVRNRTDLHRWLN